jgi:UDP-glucose 4-epimerase
LVTGGAGYIGSHTVLSLALTRRFKVVSIDNYHNSFPLALSRIEDVAAAALPPDASPDDIESTKIDAWTADLTCEDQVRAVFAHYGPAAFWGVIHIAVRFSTRSPTRTPLTFPTGIQGSRRVE